MRALDSQSEEASTYDVLGADKTSLYRSAVARLNYWAVDRLDMQYAVRMCSKSMPSRRQEHESVSAGNIRYGQHLLRSCSKDQIVIAMSRAVRRMHGGRASHGNGEHGKKVGSAS